MKTFAKGLFAAVCAILAATALGLGLLHCCDLLFRADIALLGIEEASGLSKADILANYHAVMRYLSPFSRAEFSLPSLIFSADGAAHFADTKRIFAGVYLAGIVGAVSFLWMGMRKLLSPSALRVAGGSVFAIPAVILAGMAVNFDAAFILFHKIFFPGATNWVFYYDLDPVKLILPDEFFLHCAVFIALLWVVAGAALLFAAYITRKNRVWQSVTTQ